MEISNSCDWKNFLWVENSYSVWLEIAIISECKLTILKNNFRKQQLSLTGVANFLRIKRGNFFWLKRTTDFSKYKKLILVAWKITTLWKNSHFLDKWLLIIIYAQVNLVACQFDNDISWRKNVLVPFYHKCIVISITILAWMSLFI